jgi:hypothetical protein
MSLLFHCLCHFFSSSTSASHSGMYSWLGSLYSPSSFSSLRGRSHVVPALRYRLVSCHTHTGGEGREAVACKQCGASLVFLVIDLPLAIRIKGGASNVACRLSCSIGGAMLSSTRGQRYRLASPASLVAAVPEATRVSAAASQSLHRLVSGTAVAALIAANGFARYSRPLATIVVSSLVPARLPYFYRRHVVSVGPGPQTVFVEARLRRWMIAFGRRRGDGNPAPSSLSPNPSLSTGNCLGVYDRLRSECCTRCSSQCGRSGSGPR